jgi:carbonic anhydrase
MSEHNMGSENPPCHPKFFQRSPIDFQETLYHPFDLGQVEFDYPRTTVAGVADIGHLKVNVNDDVHIPLFGLHLKLLQLHFHAPSEHLVSGVSFPLELHLVHQIVGGQSGMTEGSDLLVIGVFFFASQDAKKQRALPQIGKYLSDRKARGAGDSERGGGTISFDPNHCLPDHGNRSRFFRYEGSLTSGTLDETVSWLVFERPVPVVESDLAPILQAAEQEARDPEPLNRRAVLRSFP